MHRPKPILLALVAAGCSACATLHSQVDPAGMPPIRHLLVVAVQRENAHRYAELYRTAFPPGYAVRTMGLDELSLVAPDSLVRREANARPTDAVLWLTARPSGSYKVVPGANSATPNLELYGELRPWPANRSVWNVRAPIPGLLWQVPPSRVVRQLQRDGLIGSAGPLLAAETPSGN